MDLTSLRAIKTLCRKYHIYPSKQRGQNFLIDRKVLDKIVSAARLKKDDVVLEIGPGFGVLTQELAKRAKRVLAVEADKRLVMALHEILANYKNVTMVQEDILKFSIFNFQSLNKFSISNFQFSNYGYKIVANLPYQITSAVLRRFLENEPRPSEMVVMVQKEVAERICAKPGKMSLLSVSVQFFGKPEIIKAVPRTAFWPEPEVDSAIIRIVTRKEIEKFDLRGITQEDFFRIVRIGFSARRKQLQNNLAAGLRLPNEVIRKKIIECGFDPKIRAQDLSVEDWIKLANQLNNYKN